MRAQSKKIMKNLLDKIILVGAILSKFPAIWKVVRARPAFSRRENINRLLCKAKKKFRLAAHLQSNVKITNVIKINYTAIRDRRHLEWARLV